MTSISFPGPEEGRELFSDHPGHDWAMFYSQVFGIHMPRFKEGYFPKRKGFDWPLIVAPMLSIPRIMRVTTGFYDWWMDSSDAYQTDLFITYHARIPFQAYVVWLKPGLQVEATHDGHSAKDVRSANVQGITLLERLLMELFVFWRTSHHLDTRRKTLCTGSGYIDQGVPLVFWEPEGRLRIEWHDPEVGIAGAACREVYSPMQFTNLVE